jgi:hypothetical protein
MLLSDGVKGKASTPPMSILPFSLENKCDLFCDCASFCFRQGRCIDHSGFERNPASSSQMPGFQVCATCGTYLVFCFVFCGAGDGAKGLMYAGQVLYH